MRKVAAVLILIFMSFFVGHQAQAAIVDEIRFYVKNYYYGEVPAGIDQMKTIDEIMKGLDPYSLYMTKAEYESYMNSIHIPGLYENLTGNTMVNTVQPKVESQLLFGNVAHITVPSFQVETPQAVVREWESLKKSGAKSLILDFRFNGGGTVASAEAIIGMFNNAPKAYTRYNRDSTIEVPAAKSTVKFPGKPYVLVNRYSASASELVAAAVKDQNAGILVGQKTFGKGSVQSFFELSDGGALKLTTAHFTGPGGSDIHGIGIMPDVPTEFGKELEFAHTALTKAELKTWRYAEIPEVEAEAPGGPIEVSFSQEMNFSAPAASNRVELIRMGNAKPVPVRVEQKDSGTLRIVPEVGLEKNAVYVLMIHPRFADTSGIYMREGTYLFIRTM